jgi:hypothetical protein
VTSLSDWPEHVQDAFVAYRNQPWERSLRRLGREIGIHPSKLFHWSADYGWTKHIQAFDLQTRGVIFDRRKWRTAERKILKWGVDSRFWARADRRRYQRMLNSSLAARERWRTTNQLPEDLRAFMRAVSRHYMWECRKYGPQVVMTRLQQRQPHSKAPANPPQYLGSA